MSFIKRGNLETCKRDVQADNSHPESEKITPIPLFEDDAPFFILLNFLYNPSNILINNWYELHQTRKLGNMQT